MSATSFPDNMGAVSGIVGMAGGLGGFLLPIMFGAILDWLGINSSCFMLLYGIVWVSLILNYLTEVRKAPVMGEATVAAELDLIGSRKSHEPFPRTPDLSYRGVESLRRRSWRTARRRPHVGGRLPAALAARQDRALDAWRELHRLAASWKIYVKSGVVTWETQQTDYPRTRRDMPNHEPRGCSRGASL